MTTDGRRTRLRAERGANRAAIIRAAEAALRERPFREVSVEEVMQQAGLARTQFYRHFDDLPDLVLNVAGAAFTAILAAHEQLVAEGALTVGAIREGHRQAVAAFAEHGPLVRGVFEAAIHDGIVEEAVTATHDRFIAITTSVVALAAQQGAPIASVEQTARLLHFGNVGYLVDCFGGAPKVTPDAALDTIVAQWAAVLGIAA